MTKQDVLFALKDHTQDLGVEVIQWFLENASKINDLKFVKAYQFIKRTTPRSFTIVLNNQHIQFINLSNDWCIIKDINNKQYDNLLSALNSIIQ